MSIIEPGQDVIVPLVQSVIGRSGIGLAVLDEDLRYVFVNEVAADLCGRPAEHHLGKRVEDVIPSIASAVVPSMRRALESGEPVRGVEVEGVLPGTDGRTGHWMASYVPFRSDDGLRLAAVIVEITEQKQAQQRLSLLIDSLFTFVGLCSPDGTLLEANETALAAAGLSRDDVVGRPFWETYWWSHSAEAQERLRAAVERAARCEASRFDVEVQVAGGDLITIDFQLVPIVEDGRVTALVPSGLDITERVAEHDRTVALAELSRRLSQTTTTAAVAQLVVEFGPRVVAADLVNVGLIDEEQRTIELLFAHPDPAVHDRWRSVSLQGERTPFHDVVSTGRPVYVEPDTRAQLYPHLVEAVAEADLATTAALPLTDESGRVFGAIGMGWSDGPTISDTMQAQVELLADICGRAMSRARTAETRLRLIDELQAETLASAQIPTGLDVAVAYRPANNDVGFGGDWYDVVELGPDRTAFVVGDVAGHGTSAAARMTATKATIRAFTTAFPPEEVIPRSTEALAHLDSGYVATVALAWLDLRREELQWCLAGHPPPVLRTPDGATRLLDGVHHPPIGMRRDPCGLPTVAFPPGSKLILYTDGLIERRGEDLDVRLEALRSLVESLPTGLPITELCERLIADLSDGHDDVAIIVIRRPR